jgi:hypothetical protein
MNMLKKNHHLNVDVRKKGYVFAKYIVCDSLKDLISKLGKNSCDVREYEPEVEKTALASRVVQKLVLYLEV